MRMVNGHLQFSGGGVSVEGSVTISDGNWHHVAVSYDGTNIKLYVDGVADGSGSVTLNTSGTVLRLGRRNDPAGGEYFTGMLDEVRVWSLSKSVTEINADKYRSVAYDASGLVVSYRLMRAAGQLLAMRWERIMEFCITVHRGYWEQ